MNKKIPDKIYTLILTTIALVSWVFFSVYWAVKKPLPVVISPEITAPIQESVDTESIEKLKERKYFEESSLRTIEFKTPTSTYSNNSTLTPSTQTSEINASEASENKNNPTTE